MRSFAVFAVHQVRYRALSLMGATGTMSTRTRALNKALIASLAGTLLLAACGGSGDGGGSGSPGMPSTPTAPVTPSPVPSGILAISASGLPDGVALQASVVGPYPGSTFSRSTSAPVTWTDIPSGRYTVSVRNTRGVAGAFAGAPASFEVDVPAGGPPSPAVAVYRAVPSALALDIGGLPASAKAEVFITPPNGTRTPVTQSALHTAPQLASGQYTPDAWRVAAEAVLVDGARYVPSRAALDSVVAFGDTARVDVRYTIATGALAVVVAGLPAGLPGQVLILAPDRTLRTVDRTTTITGLEPGHYRLVASNVVRQGVTFRAPADTLEVDVVASLTAAPATITYVAQVGTLALTVNGLPSSAEGAITLFGNGITRTLTTTGTADSLPVGSYTLTASAIVADGDRYAPTTASQNIVITTGTSSKATVTYALASGSLALTVRGLPDGVAGDVNVSGPNGYAKTLNGPGIITGLLPGRYTVAARPVQVGSETYGVVLNNRTVDIVASATPVVVSLQYESLPAAIDIPVTGLPAGYNASISLTGPSGEHYSIIATQQLAPVTPGRWRLTANPVTTPFGTYVPTPALRDSVVRPGETLDFGVRYAVNSGALALAVVGLPNGVAGAVTISGPSGFSRTATGTTTYTGLVPGSYTVSAASVAVGAATYAPSPASQVVTVAASNVAAPATVTYAVGGGGGGGGGGGALNYRIAGVHLTQAIQRPDGAVPLVAGREALLRVFVTASGANSGRPDVRVRLYDGPTLLQTSTITAPEASVRTITAEGTLNSTWNVRIPAANMRPSLRMLVELDPADSLSDADRSDNVWPAGGTPQTMPVLTVPTFNVRFVPIVTGTRTGNVSAANSQQFLATARQLWPIRDIASDVRLPFTSSQTTLQANDDNGAWLTVLSELNALRAADGAPSAMHYYGVLKVTYTSGIAGLGYVPGRSAIGWDYLPSGDGVAAHEWGHNFSRQHAPCGVAGDPSYPYPNGIIGNWGWNSLTNTLVAPTATDLMSYCDNTWVSDYSWSAVLQYRNNTNLVASARSTTPLGPTDGLLVWGRVVNGAIQLEPAFLISAPITPAAAVPTHRLDLLDETGASLLQLPIEAALVDHATGHEERQFAVVVPWSATLEARLQSVRVSDVRLPTRSAIRRSARAPGLAGAQAAPSARVMASDDPEASLTTEGRQLRINWRNPAYGMALVRDAASGQILGFVRESGREVHTAGRRVHVVFSDGVRTIQTPEF